MRSHLIPPEKWREFRKGKELDEAKNTIREIQVFFTCDSGPTSNNGPNKSTKEGYH